MVGNYRKPVMVNGKAIYTLGAARANLTEIVNAVQMYGTIALIHSKGRRVALVPMFLINELNDLRALANKYAAIAGEDVPRISPTLLPEVTGDDAHSPEPIPSPREVLKTAFGMLGPYKGNDDGR